MIQTVFISCMCLSNKDIRLHLKDFFFNFMIKLFTFLRLYYILGSSWSWSHGSLIYNYLCNQRLLPLTLWVWILLRARCTALCDKICHWLVAGQWFSSVSSNNQTDRCDITEILLKVVLNTITPPQAWAYGHKNFENKFVLVI